MLVVKNNGIVMLSYPLPPSSNHIYRPFYIKQIGAIRHTKTKELKQFGTEADVYSIVNRVERRRAIMVVKSWLAKAPYVSIDAFFAVPVDKILTKKNTIKRTDAMNHLKALFDSISIFLETDDRHFTVRRCEYVHNDAPAAIKTNSCLIRMQPRQISSVSSLMEDWEDELERRI